ncbi:MAG TPA: SIS domain-containing protein [Bryobacteraceae bacterium]|nr:SIS domain-containing protein [Bryobacteraceae bacterium]
MLDEIREQPAALERTLRAGWKAAAGLKRAIARKPPKLILLAARGTSDNAAQFARYLLEIATGIPVSLAAPSIFTVYGATVDLKDALVVAISQSGESTDTNLVLQRAREQGALTVAVTNEPKSSLAGLAEHLFLVRAGRERSVAATKTYTGQLLLCYLLAHALGAKIRPEDLQRLPEWTAAALTLEAQISGRAERYRFMERAVVVGRGLNYANAFEFALKMMETCYILADSFSAADFLHGPIAMVERSFPVFLFTPRGPTWPGMRDMLLRLTQLKAETLIFTDRGHREAVAMNPRAVIVPAGLKELFTPIPYIIPAQLFTAFLAGEKGLDPDRPRTLSKVTRTL